MTRRALVERSVARCAALERRYPGLEPVESLARQLAYLLDREEGRTVDCSGIERLTIRVIAAREIEPRDPELADLLSQLMDRLGI